MKNTKSFIVTALILVSSIAFANRSSDGVYSTDNNELIMQILNEGTKIVFYQGGICVATYIATHYDDSHVSLFDEVEGTTIELRWQVENDRITIWDFIVNGEDITPDDSPDIFYRREAESITIASGDKI